MPSHRFTVSVPQPCHEDWNAMMPQNQGRFCQSCSKTVVDFTAMSDAEVVAWLSKQKSSTCGRFKGKQLGRELVAVSASRNRWTWQAVTLGLAAWLSAKTTEAQQITSMQAHEPIENTNILAQPYAVTKVSPLLLSEDSLVIKGVVLDLETKEQIPGVGIFLKGKRLATYTDGDGRFAFNLSDTQITDEEVITFHFIGYITQEKKVSELLKGDYQIISMETDSHLTGEVVIVESGKWYSPRSFYYRVRNLFRN